MRPRISFSNLPQGALALASCLYLSACGSGTAALFSGSNGTNETPQMFQVNLAVSQPTLSSTLSAAVANQDASTRLLTINFNQAVDATTVQAADFRVTRIDEDENRLETRTIEELIVSGSDVQFMLDEALYLNGAYLVEFLGSLQAANGTEFTAGAPRSGYIRVGTGQFDALEESVAFGNLVAGGLRLGSGNLSFVSLEAQVGSFFFLATATGVGGVFETPELLYQNNGASFNQLNTSSILLNQDTAVLRTQEGRVSSSIHNVSDSIRVRCIPGMIQPDTGDLVWPKLVSAGTAAGVDQYTIDKGPLFGELGPDLLPSERTISWRPRLMPLRASQVSGPRGRNVAVWWAWSDPDDALDRYNRYHVVANSLDVQANLDISEVDSLADWPTATVLSDLDPAGADTSVGWPYTTVWENGNVLALWNDADSLEGVYRGDIQSIKGSRYDVASDSWSPVGTYAPVNPLGRIGDIKTLGDDEVLVFSRFDEDGDPSVSDQFCVQGGAAVPTPERASVRVRRLRIGSDGSIQESPGAVEVVALPSSDPDGHYGISLGTYAGAFSTGAQLPAASSYNLVRVSDSENNPLAARIAANRFLVRWSAIDNFDTDPCDGEPASGDSQIFLAIFDGETMSFVDAQPLEVFSAMGMEGTSNLITVQIDLLGFATVVFADRNEAGRVTRIRSVRSAQSLVSGTLSQAFTSANETEIVAQAELEEDIFLTAITVSNVNAAGHFAVSWGRSLFPDPNSNQSLLLGTNSNTLR